MKPSSVYEIILRALHVLNTFYVVTSANNVARDDSNENGQTYFNNSRRYEYINNIMEYVGQLLSFSQMWTCVQYLRDHGNVKILSVQMFNNVHKDIRIHQMLSNENMYTRIFAMDITYTSRNHQHHNYLHTNQHHTIDCIYDGFELKYIFFNKQKHSAVVIVMAGIPLSNGVCKWIGQTGANKTFGGLFVNNYSSTTLMQMPNMIINNIWSSSNVQYLVL
ncbi:hypothetical protein RFI_38482 [Reticulomyxa filosa]|uniref:Uncharacterized protein n=1 Tax=Reticulomyxa filosa TaxID=46433 RepID=X6LCC9_RETFI|nr:hypothetical protein RFI_38482 [Reticulomyxa filosa]|eukprot:ETN99005.1 hypothetical protein RFI_38482 [Reticulomyxa filosa]